MLSARHRRRTALVPLAMLLALALSVRATTDSRRVTFTIPIAPIALGLDALPLVTPEGAVRRVALVLRDDLRLPLPAEVTLRLYATPKLFEQGLVQDGGWLRRSRPPSAGWLSAPASSRACSCSSPASGSDDQRICAVAFGSGCAWSRTR